MCYFVIVAFPSDALAVAEGLLRSAYHMEETENPSLLEALPDGWIAAHLSDERCGCGLYADPRGEDIRSPEARAEAVRRKYSKPKYRKRGWSDAKIERAVQQARDESVRRPGSTLRGMSTDVRRAIAQLSEAVGEVRAIVHFFSGMIDDEAILADVESLGVTEFMTDDQAIMPDVWYAITSR